MGRTRLRAWPLMSGRGSLGLCCGFVLALAVVRSASASEGGKFTTVLLPASLSRGLFSPSMEGEGGGWVERY